VTTGRTTNARGGNGGTGLIVISYAYISDARPIITVPNPNGLSYRTSVTLTSTAPIAGSVNFFLKGKRIPGCQKRPATLSGSNYIATCTWLPASNGSAPVSATVVATDTVAGNQSNTTTFFILKRGTKR
jgi:hypothetical protein